MNGPRARLALAWVAGFTLIDASIVSLALPDIARQFDRSIGDLAWVATAYLLALAASLLAGGRLSDRYSPRIVMAVGAVGFGVTTLLCGIAPTFELLVGFRAAQGVFGGIIYTVSLAIAATAFPPERRATAISIYFTSGATGAVLGPVLGGWLTDVGGWRVVFLAQLPLPLLVLAMTLAFLPRTPGRREPFDVPGVISAGLFIAAASFAMLQLPTPNGVLSAALAALIAVLALVAFIAIEKRSPAPAVRLSIFRNPHFVVGSVCGAAAWFAIMSAIVYVALYLQFARGFEATQAGLILLAPPAVALIFFPFGGAAVRRLGVDRALLLGLGLMVGAGVAMIGWGAATDPWWLILVLVANGAGIAVTLVASATDALSQFAPSEQGTGSAVFNSLRQLGAAFGVAAPAVAFELVAQGSRAPDAALGGSAAAFSLRVAVLAIPLLLVLLRWRPAAVADRAADRAA
ncbi:MAG: MFS transporter [Chloroflexota bacterium]|nr:MFS transporter [Chloroflexota bacterium]